MNCPHYRLKLSLECRSPGSLSTWHFPSAINNTAILKADSSIMFYAAEFKLVRVAQCYTYFRQRLCMLMKHMKCCSLNHLFCPLNDLWRLRCDWYDCGDWSLSLRRLEWQITHSQFHHPLHKGTGRSFDKINKRFLQGGLLEKNHRLNGVGSSKSGKDKF